MSQPSILFVNRVLPPDRGATGCRLAELAHAFVAKGWRVTLLAEGRADAGSPRLPPGAKVVRTGGATPKAAFGYMVAWFRLAARAVRLPRHDIVVTLTDPPMLALLGPVLAGIRRSRLIHWCHDLYPDLLPVLGQPVPRVVLIILRWLMRWSLCRHDAIVAIGRCMADRLAAMGIPPGQLSVVPNWADRSIVPDDAGGESVRQALGLDGRFVIVYSGTFGLAHPFEAVFEAADLLAERAPEVRFVLVGEGRGRVAIEEELARRPRANVVLLPWQPDARVSAILGAADLHLAIMAEGAAGLLVPNKVVGALAAGRPCLFLGPEASCAADFLRETGTGIVLPPRNGETLVGAIQHAADDLRSGRNAAFDATARAAAIWGFEGAAACFLALADQCLTASTPSAGSLPHPMPSGSKP